MSTDQTPALARATEEHRCTGCGRAFATARGLAAHRSAPFQTMACKRPAAPTPATTPPALARATEAVREAWGDANIDGHGDEGAGYDESVLARAALSAALHDPDDPDWLARTILGGSSATRWASLSDELRNMYRREADAVRAAILGPSS